MIKSIRFSQWSIGKKLWLIIAASVSLVGLYCLSVVIRVSEAEQTWFGRSTLIPLAIRYPNYNLPGSSESYFSPTYDFSRPDGKTVRVHKQLINGFQHAYGSALVRYELGRRFSDYLFRANEYAESYVFCRKSCGTLDYALDTRKDLANNAIGRSIGTQARHHKIEDGYNFILSQTLRYSDEGVIYPHLKDPRVANLPTEEQFGCVGLYLTNPKLH